MHAVFSQFPGQSIPNSEAWFPVFPGSIFIKNQGQQIFIHADSTAYFAFEGVIALIEIIVRSFIKITHQHGIDHEFFHRPVIIHGVCAIFDFVCVRLQKVSPGVGVFLEGEILAAGRGGIKCGEFIIIRESLGLIYTLAGEAVMGQGYPQFGMLFHDGLTSSNVSSLLILMSSNNSFMDSVIQK